MRAGDAARLGYGLLLLSRPDRVAQVVGLSPLDRRARITARILGGRQVAQALVLHRHGGPGLRRAGRAVDLLHAGSMLLLAAWAPGRARTALADATIAALFAGSSGPAEDESPTPPPPPGLRTQAPQSLLDLPAPVYPDGPSVPADPDPTDGATARRQRRRARQDALREVLETARGRTLEETKRALAAALEARGLSQTPDPWIEAAAIDLVNGNIYVVNGPAMQDTGLELPPHGPA